MIIFLRNYLTKTIDCQMFNTFQLVTFQLITSIICQSQKKYRISNKILTLTQTNL